MIVLYVPATCFPANAEATAVEIGLSASEVLSTFPSPTCVFVTECGLLVLAT